jgi:hypothetical protein
MQPAERYAQYLDDAVLSGAAPDDAGFHIHDDGAANWALGKLAEVEAATARRAAFVAAEIARLQAWQAAEDAKGQRFADYLTGQLRTYYDGLRQQGLVSARRKSYVLPNGRLTVRTQAATWRRDEARLLAWAEPLGLVRRQVTVNWIDVKKRLAPPAGALAEAIDAQTGEVIPGLRCQQGPCEVFHALPALDGKQVHDDE